MTSGSEHPSEPAREGAGAEPSPQPPSFGPEQDHSPFQPTGSSQPYGSAPYQPGVSEPGSSQQPQGYPQPWSYAPPSGYQQGYPPQPPYPPQQGYQQPQGYPPQPPYPPQQGYPVPPASQQYPLQPATPQQVTPPPASRVQPQNPFLGRLSLLLVSISAVAAVVTVIPIGQVMAEVMLAAGSTSIDNETMAAALQSSAAGPSSVFGLVMAVGIASALTGLVAAISRRGRAAGIAAVVVGVLAPVAWMIALMVTLYPAVAALVG